MDPAPVLVKLIATEVSSSSNLIATVNGRMDDHLEGTQSIPSVDLTGPTRTGK